MEINEVGIVGAGAMGSGIAQVASTAGHHVFLYDTSADALAKSKAKLDKVMSRLVEKGKYSDEKATKIKSNISYTQDLGDMKNVDLVVEAIVEDVVVKKELFSTLEGIIPEETVLASNTSSLSIASIASSCNKPERVLGLHFFNPAPLMALVEVIPAVSTSKNLVPQMQKLMSDWGKEPAVAKDTPGFIVNRVARPFYGEALRIAEEGLATHSQIDRVMKELGGFRMGPFELMDFIGHDVNYKVTETVFEAFYYDQRYKPSFAQKRLVEAGWLGRKSGRGFYRYDSQTPPEQDNDGPLLKEVFNRILYMLINEAADALYLGVGSAEDIDIAMTKGVNYPKGLLAWADSIGVDKVLKGLDDLYERYHEDRYRASVLLRDMAANNQTFFK